MKKLLPAILLFCICLFHANGLLQARQPGGLADVNVIARDLEQAPEKFLVIDVRTPEEYKSGYLQGAKNIDFLVGDFERKINDLPRDRPIVLYCRSGGRSARAEKIMRKAGFANVADMRGGILEWERAGYKIEK